MASPQKENGFTGIANEILEMVQKYKFTLNELKIVMCVWRFTYGFSRKEHGMSLSFFMKHTGLNRSRVNDSIKKLVEYEVIIVAKQGNAKTSSSYSFNKDYDSWKIEKYTSFTSEQNNTSVQDDTSIKNDTRTSVQDDTRTSVQDDTQERNIKTNIKQEEEEEKNPVILFESQFGIMTPFQMDLLWRLVDDFDNQEIVCLAIKETALKNPRTPFKYLERILNDWMRRKFLTVDDVLKEKERFNQQIGKAKGQQSKVLDWEALASE